MGEKLRSGTTREELALDPDFTHLVIKYPHGAAVVEGAFRGRPKPRPDLRVTFCFGEANCGKSLCTGSKTIDGSDLPGNPWLAKFKGEFAIGYHYQKKFIFDDFTGATMQPTELQQLCDTTPHMFNVKNGERPCVGTDIRISSNFLPDKWWKQGTNYNARAIATRLHECHYHWKDDEGKYHVAIYHYPEGKDRSTIGPKDLTPLERMEEDYRVFPSYNRNFTRADIVKQVVYDKLLL